MFARRNALLPLLYCIIITQAEVKYKIYTFVATEITGTVFNINIRSMLAPSFKRRKSLGSMPKDSLSLIRSCQNPKSNPFRNVRHSRRQLVQIVLLRAFHPPQAPTNVAPFIMPRPVLSVLLCCFSACVSVGRL